MALAAVAAVGCGADAPDTTAGEPNADETTTAQSAPEFTDPIAFQRFANTGATPTVPGFYGGADIWIMEGDGSGPRLVRKGVPQHLDHPSLSDIDGSNQRRLTASDANDGHPWFSRDGRFIVFESDRSGNWEIWKIEIESGQVAQLTDDPAYVSTRPRW